MSHFEPAVLEDPDDDAAADMARAVRRRAVLEHLSEVGMRLAEEIAERAINSPYHPEGRHDPGRSFAAVSRAVRFTVVLEARADADVIALRKGALAPARVGLGLGLLSQPKAIQPIAASISEDPLGAERAKVRDAVAAVISREVGDSEAAQAALERVHERLIEGEAYEAYLSQPWRGCVEAICADLGLTPDWRLWSVDGPVTTEAAGCDRETPAGSSSAPAPTKGTQRGGRKPPATGDPPEPSRRR